MEVSKLILNPIRMRIIQFLMGHESTTAGELLGQKSKRFRQFNLVINSCLHS